MGPVSEPARYQRSVSGLIGALLILLAIIGVFVALRAFSRTDVEIKPTAVDYLAEVSYAQQQGARLVYPAALPKGWIATSIDRVPGAGTTWGVGMLTANGKFAGFRQQDAPLADLLATYVDKSPTEGAPVTVPGSVVPRWRTFSDSGGDHAFAARVAGDTVLVYGSASVDDLRTLVATLTTKRR